MWGGGYLHYDSDSSSNIRSFNIKWSRANLLCSMCSSACINSFTVSNVSLEHEICLLQYPIFHYIMEYDNFKYIIILYNSMEGEYTDKTANQVHTALWF